MSSTPAITPAALNREIRARLRRGRRRRGVALVLVLGSLTILTVMLTEFQSQTSAELSSALYERDAVRAEYAARSAVNLSRLLIATEPTVRQALSPVLMLLTQGQGVPQLPVWNFADQVLGGLADAEGMRRFSMLAGVNADEAENVGLDGATYEITIVDEDSKLNVNLPARGTTFVQERVAAQLSTLIGGAQYDDLFERRDLDGEFSDRRDICSAIIDFVDPDQKKNPCTPRLAINQGEAGPEEPFYQRLQPPYEAKNAGLDSLEELRMVRGVGDDFWSNFVDPDPDNPSKRLLTVWGTEKVNVNNANPVTLWTLICQNAVPGQEFCENPEALASFVMLMTLVQGMTMNAPLFGQPKAFVRAVQGELNSGIYQLLAQAMNIPPVKLASAAELEKVIATESQVFGIYATGIVRSGKRETRVRVHAVIDFRTAPKLGTGILGTAQATAGSAQGAGTAAPLQAATNLPQGATQNAIQALFRPNPAGKILYYRID